MSKLQFTSKQNLFPLQQSSILHPSNHTFKIPGRVKMKNIEAEWYWQHYRRNNHNVNMFNRWRHIHVSCNSLIKYSVSAEFDIHLIGCLNSDVILMNCRNNWFPLLTSHCLQDSSDFKRSDCGQFLNSRGLLACEICGQLPLFLLCKMESYAGLTLVSYYCFQIQL